MDDRKRLYRLRTLARVRAAEHRDAAGALYDGLDAEARALALAERTSGLAASYAARRDAVLGCELAAQSAVARHMAAFRQQAAAGAQAAAERADRDRQAEQAARRRRDRAADTAATLARTIRDARDAAASPAIGRSGTKREEPRA